MTYLPKNKKCLKCGKTKSQDRFYFNKSVPDGLNSWCMQCDKSYDKQHQRGNDLRRKYGITVAQYELILKSQNGVCVICKQPETIKYRNKIRRLAVDHNHTTGKIRGLLCFYCNTLLAHVENNPEILKEIPRYLERNK